MVLEAEQTPLLLQQPPGRGSGRAPTSQHPAEPSPSRCTRLDLGADQGYASSGTARSSETLHHGRQPRPS